MLRKYPDVMNIEQMCDALRISTKTGYKLLHEGKIPAMKIGRSYRIPKAHLFTYLQICGQHCRAENRQCWLFCADALCICGCNGKPDPAGFRDDRLSTVAEREWSAQDSIPRLAPPVCQAHDKKIYNFFWSFSGSFIAAHSCFKWVFTVIPPFQIPLFLRNPVLHIQSQSDLLERRKLCW